MDFPELVQKRYSVRAYKPEPLKAGELDQILLAARLAPTAANRQAFQLIVIQTAGRESELQQIYGRDWFVQAPLVICACGLPDRNWVRSDGKNYNDVDVAIVVDHLILAAADLGIGTCWIGAFDSDAARKVLGLPDGVEPIAFTPLGYPADQSPADEGPASQARTKVRKDLSELVRYEHW